MKLTLFPLYRINENGTCGCGDEKCKNVGKHPAFAWSHLKAGEQVSPHPGQGAGIVTGARSGIVVIDCDVKEEGDGRVNFRSLVSTEDLDTYTVRSPSGSEHFYYETELELPCSVSKLAAYVDVRGEGGFVVSEGSPHRLGGKYVCVNSRPIRPLPDHLATKILASAVRRVVKGSPADPIDLATPEGVRHLSAAEEYLKAAPLSIEGEDGSGVFFVVCMHLMRRFRLDIETAEHLVCEIYNPRLEEAGTEMWIGEQLTHKLEDASVSDMDQGLVPVDFGKGWMTPKAVPITRKLPDPNHAYTWHLGEFDSSQWDNPGKKVRIDDAQVVDTLLRHPAWEGVFQHNVFKDCKVAINPPTPLDLERGVYTDVDVTRVVNWFACVTGCTTNSRTVKAAIPAVCSQRPFHPVREYLNSLEGGDPAYLKNLGTEIFGPSNEMADVFWEKFLVSAVRRILCPGTKVDTLPVIYGPQGSRKTTLLSVLFGQEWVRGQMPALNNRDSSHALDGYWCVEFGELDQVIRAESATVKDFLSRPVDTYRQFGNGEKIETPRQCVFVGTTNEDNFLRDSTGNRRYWPIEVTKEEIDLEYVRRNRDKIWAAAKTLAADASYCHWLTPSQEKTAEEDSREPFIYYDAWDDAVLDYCKGKECVSTAEILTKAISMEMARITPRDTHRMVTILQRMGAKAVREPRPSRRRGYLLPASISGAPESDAELKRRAAAEALEKLMKN